MPLKPQIQKEWSLFDGCEPYRPVVSYEGLQPYYQWGNNVNSLCAWHVLVGKTPTLHAHAWTWSENFEVTVVSS